MRGRNKYNMSGLEDFIILKDVQPSNVIYIDEWLRVKLFKECIAKLRLKSAEKGVTF